MSARRTRTRDEPPASLEVLDAAEPASAGTLDAAKVPEGRRGFADRIAPQLRGYALLPLVILFLLNFVDEFDRLAFGVLTPEIKQAFGLSDAGVGAIAALAGGFVWIGTPAVGYVADRWKRVDMSWIAAVVWGFMSLFTGIVGAVWLLAIVRFGSGLAKTVNEPVHNALLSDYYPPEARGRVFGLHRIANPLAGIVAPPLAGAIAHFFNWEAAFLLLAIPTFVVAYLAAAKLKEPMRGGTEDAAAAEEAAKEPPVPYARAVRWLYSVPTLKRIYLGSFFSGMGIISFLSFLAIYYEDEFSLGTLGRGFLVGVGNVFALAGILLAARWTDRIQRTRSFADLGWLFGGSVAALGVSLVVLAAAPVLWLAAAAGFVASFFGGSWIAPYFTVTAYVSPARIRALGFSYAAMFFALGTIGVPVAGAISDAHGVRWALLLAAIVLTAGGAILSSCSRFVDKDINRALHVLATEAELRRERLVAGSRSLLSVRNLDVGYDGVQVLFGVNLDVREGELVALLGTNGAGKSTLLKAVSGLLHPTSGAVFFEGKDITHYEPEETAEAGIIQMPGGKAVFPSLTVRENLDMAAWLYAKERGYTQDAIGRVLEIFPVLRERLDQQAGSMSGGEQQMLSLAQAFIARPKLLMIDELSLGLAPLIVQQLLAIVQEIHERGTTIILVEQSVNVALTVAQHAYFMEKGEIRFDGPTAELLERGDILRSVFLEGAGAVVREPAALRPNGGPRRPRRKR